ncbi:putative galacturonosyltransferase 4 [Camellia lanceoleosa]|uniref:Galacturonosyltransferase 4 n=1 Tax=Camellia lanceoleosa TaxID=1840588 RepID=A0ACC0FJJ4_9ERIC|nr:putative galacturonosyltransferase 4 [Camellia lanceoleosa]
MHLRRNSEVEWNLNFRRSLFQWEVDDLNRLKLLLMNALDLRENRADSLHWKADPSGYFTVSSAYKWCDNSLHTMCKDCISTLRHQFWFWRYSAIYCSTLALVSLECGCISVRISGALKHSINHNCTGDRHPEEKNPIRQETKLEKQSAKTSVKFGAGEPIKTKIEKQNDKTVMPSDARVRHLKDQLIQGRVYLSLTATRNNSHFIRELRLRMKEAQRSLGEATKDSELPRNFAMVVHLVVNSLIMVVSLIQNSASGVDLEDEKQEHKSDLSKKQEHKSDLTHEASLADTPSTSSAEIASDANHSEASQTLSQDDELG